MNRIEIPFRLPSLNQEEWKYIKNSNEYEISTIGNIRRNKRNLKISDKPIYKIIRLKLDDRYKTYYIHRLVAETFIPNKDKKEFVNHIDGNKHNNSVSNLEWCTRQENEIHAWKNGMKEKIRTTSIANAKTARSYIHTNKLVRQFDLNMNFIKEWDSAFRVQKQIGIDSSAISKCCRKKLKKAGGYIWQFVE